MFLVVIVYTFNYIIAPGSNILTLHHVIDFLPYYLSNFRQKTVEFILIQNIVCCHKL